MVSTRAHKKCAVAKRAAYFNLIATDFPLHRQDFWIPSTFNGISTDKGTFASLGRRSVEVRDGRGRQISVREWRLNQAVQRCIENGRAPRGNVLVIKHWAGCMDFTDIECWDRGIVNDIFQSRLPTAIGHRILQESGLREWTMVKRVSRFHSAEVSRFMDAQLLQLLKIYIKDAGALGSKTVSGFPMILGFGDTLGCCFVNGTGLYMGYPDDVTEKKVVIGHTGPYAMPPLHGQKEFRTLSVVNDICKSADCGWHCNGLWCTFMDAGSARHLWCSEMVEDEGLHKEVDFWQWNTGSPCKNPKCPRYNLSSPYTCFSIFEGLYEKS
ncbi:hypothetical protein C8J55DRAFT_494446 [Lentinula edodes]|uniref:Uncharacterized protein n=1 Tax=Lentinula lateritia TaxID=40482 RepID=A0A9W9DD49_9AGAR|nr:hypothetical protein C8J55DRAFT_494446 [Lentinula edodes]